MSRSRLEKKFAYNLEMKRRKEFREWIESKPPKWKVISFWLWRRRHPRWLIDWRKC